MEEATTDPPPRRRYKCPKETQDHTTTTTISDLPSDITCYIVSRLSRSQLHCHQQTCLLLLPEPNPITIFSSPAPPPKLKARHDEVIEEGSGPLSDEQLSIDVFGFKSGYIRGLGRGPKLSTSFLGKTYPCPTRKGR